MPLVLTLFAGFQAELSGRTLAALPTEKSRALLAYLAVTAGTAQPRRKLAGLLWPELTDAAAAANLRKTLFRLQGSFDDHEPGASSRILKVGRREVTIESTAIDSDVRRFEALLEECRVHPHRHLETCEICIKTLEDATRLYQGEILEGLHPAAAPEFDEWLLLTRSGLQQQAVQALMSLASAYSKRNEHDRALAALARLLHLDPYAEAGHRERMRVLAANGDHQAALAHFRAWRQRLADEFGLEPEVRTVALFDELSNGELHRERQETPLHGLPPHTGPCLGRKSALLDLEALLTEPDAKVVTLLGTGGTGKTRLAVALAEKFASLGAFADGIYFVALEQATSRDEFWLLLAGRLGLGATSNAEREARVLAHLRTKQCLLILDNFEQLLDAAEAVTTLVQAAPSVRAVITSRAALDLSVEYRFSLEGLSYPEDDPVSQPLAYGAVRLFVEAARKVQPSFELTHETGPHVVAICRAVTGLPLAIELAAAWMGVLDCDAIAESISHNLALLTSTKRDVPERHRSMAATFAYSWQLLPDEARRVLASLSVFRGPFSLAAVLDVTDAGIVELAILLDHSLLRRTPGGKYRLHELLRQLAAERLASDPEKEHTTKARHATRQLRFVTESALALHGPDAQHTLTELRDRHADVRAAWLRAIGDAAVHHELETALDGLGTYYEVNGLFAEADRLLRATVDTFRRVPEAAREPPPGQHHARLSIALRWHALFLFRLGQTDAALTVAQEALALAESLPDADLVAKADILLGELLLKRGDYQQALALQRRALEHFRQQAVDHRLAGALASLGSSLWQIGEFDSALPLLEQAEAHYRALGDVVGRADTLGLLAGIHWDQRSLARTHDLLSQAAELYSALDHPMGLAACELRLGIIDHQAGRFDEALRRNDAAAGRYLDLGNEQGYAVAIGNRAGIHEAVGDFEALLRDASEALGIAIRLGHVRQIALHTKNVGTALFHLGDDDGALDHYQRALPQLRAMGPNRFVTTALLGIAEIYLKRGLSAEAYDLADEAHTWAAAFPDVDDVCECELMRCRALAAMGDMATVTTKLTSLASNQTELHARASVRYTAWQLLGRREDAQAALALYLQLETELPTFLGKSRVAELRAVTDP